MTNLQEAPNIKNSQSIRKLPVLPPKIPFRPELSYSDYNLGHYVGTIGMPMRREGLKFHQHHQRTNSESFLIEEQLSWLDELLNEPETPKKRGAHRRSTSDSIAYVDTLNNSWSVNHLQLEGHKNRNGSPPPWIAEEFGCLKGIQNPSDNMEARLSGHAPGMKRLPHPGAGFPLPPALGQVHPLSGFVPEKLFQYETSEKRDMTQNKNTQTDLEAKRAKQQFAQRSRVRKLQYIAELERHVQTLQAERMEFSAQLQFLDRQNLMLNLENKALKQQFDNLSQEHLVKCLHQEMLEREVSHLRALHHQQQQQPAPVHSRNKSRNLESQLANLTLKQNEAKT